MNDDETHDRPIGKNDEPTAWIVAVREKLERGWRDSREGKLLDGPLAMKTIREKFEARRKAKSQKSDKGSRY